MAIYLIWKKELKTCSTFFKAWDSQYFCTFQNQNNSRWNAIFLQSKIFWSTLILLYFRLVLVTFEHWFNFLDKFVIRQRVYLYKRNCNFICVSQRVTKVRKEVQSVSNSWNVLERFQKKLIFAFEAIVQDFTIIIYFTIYFIFFFFWTPFLHCWHNIFILFFMDWKIDCFRCILSRYTLKKKTQAM